MWSGIAVSHALSWGYFALLVDRFEARQGRILKPVGGLITLALALALALALVLLRVKLGDDR